MVVHLPNLPVEVRLPKFEFFQILRKRNLDWEELLLSSLNLIVQYVDWVFEVCFYLKTDVTSFRNAANVSLNARLQNIKS